MSGRAREQVDLVRCLSFHADYACRNTGICCSSGWEIGVEEPVKVLLASRLQIRPADLPNGPDGFVLMPKPPSGCQSAFRHTPSGACWFRDAERRDCAIHREFGEDSLASACRQFPRIVVLEPHQISVSLSHYCPTAAGLLFDDSPRFAIVDRPTAFPAGWPFEGLDARTAYSPLLRPGVLLGFDGLRTLESEAVRLFSAAEVREGLRRFSSAVARIREWTPALGAVPDLVIAAFQEAAQTTPRLTQSEDPRSILVRSIPPGSSIPELPEFSPSKQALSPAVDLALRRYLAARLIAGWIVFQGEDLATAGAYLRLCLATVLLFEGARDPAEPERARWLEAIRSADLWLVHNCDPELLAKNLG